MSSIGTTSRLRSFPAVEFTGPAADGVDQQYWDGLLAGELRLQRCGSCRTWIWGPQWLCAHCHTFDPDWVAVEAVGTVFSWSRSRFAFIPELAEHLPYVTVLVELPQAGGRRVLGLLLDEDTEALAIGAAVTGVIEKPAGSEWPVLRWRLSAATTSQTSKVDAS